MVSTKVARKFTLSGIVAENTPLLLPLVLKHAGDISAVETKSLGLGED